MTKQKISRYLAGYELIGFGSLFVILWLDELLDLPCLLLGAPPTPVNLRESVLESFLVLLVGMITVYFTKKILNEIKYLEGFLAICASCKKIRDDQGNWVQIEGYIRDHSAATFSHGICPDCAAKLYPGFDLYKKKE
ncbi:MAG: hypothetical protein AB1461_12900 [Thermodesulfobacteriota bacterium]